MISRAALKAKAQAPHSGRGILSLSPLHLDLINAPVQQPPSSVAVVAGLEQTLPSQSLKDAAEKLQKQLIIKALETSAGNWIQAAKLLDLDRANLARLATRLGVKLEKS